VVVTLCSPEGEPTGCAPKRVCAETLATADRRIAIAVIQARIGLIEELAAEAGAAPGAAG
jgi:hypothetical protein